MYIPKIKNQKVSSFIASRIPFDIYAKVSTVNLFIGYYHIINDYEVMHTKHLYPHKTIKQFISDLDFILSHFTFINLADLLAYQYQSKALQKNALHLTFDDGFGEIYDVIAPILLQKGVPATFFINSSFTDNLNFCYQHKASVLIENLSNTSIPEAAQMKIEALLLQNNIRTTDVASGILSIKYQQRDLVDNIAQLLDIDFNDYLLKNKPYLTTEQINKLINQGFTIGAHSIDHPLYRDLTLEEQIRQTVESVSFVKNTFKLNYGAFAFPHSDYGVSKEYFNRIKQSGLLDVSFGTAGMINDCVHNHFQRFSLEKPLMPAQNIISYQYARTLWRIMNRNNVVKRTIV